MIVHCRSVPTPSCVSSVCDVLYSPLPTSAGVGRTGTFITVDYCMEMMEGEGMVDIFNFVQLMRYKRNYMVQTPVSRSLLSPYVDMSIMSVLSSASVCVHSRGNQRGHNVRGHLNQGPGAEGVAVETGA